MNAKQQSKYFKSIYPEVQLAIKLEYPDGVTFINSYYVGKQIQNNPRLFPFLYGKSIRFIHDCITNYLERECNAVRWNKRSRYRGGRIFVVSKV